MEKLSFSISLSPLHWLVHTRYNGDEKAKLVKCQQKEFCDDPSRANREWVVATFYVITLNVGRCSTSWPMPHQSPCFSYIDYKLQAQNQHPTENGQINVYTWSMCVCPRSFHDPKSNLHRRFAQKRKDCTWRFGRRPFSPFTTTLTHSSFCCFFLG